MTLLPCDKSAARAQQFKPQREQKQLFEGKAAARGGEGFVTGGKMNIFVGKACMAELVGKAHVLGQNVGQLVDAGSKPLLDGLIEHRLADARGERVDGHDAARELMHALALKEGIGHLRAAGRTLGAAEEDVGVTGAECVFEVRLVEIGELERAGLVDDAELDEVKPLADTREFCFASDDGADAAHFAGNKVGDFFVGAAIFVGTGKIGQEGSQVGDAEPSKRLGARFAHALDIADIGVERRHAVDLLYKCGVVYYNQLGWK